MKLKYSLLVPVFAAMALSACHKADDTVPTTTAANSSVTTPSSTDTSTATIPAAPAPAPASSTMAPDSATSSTAPGAMGSPTTPGAMNTSPANPGSTSPDNGAPQTAPTPAQDQQQQNNTK